jgi:hypothetical protein
VHGVVYKVCAPPTFGPTGCHWPSLATGVTPSGTGTASGAGRCGVVVAPPVLPALGGPSTPMARSGSPPFFGALRLNHQFSTWFNTPPMWLSRSHSAARSPTVRLFDAVTARPNETAGTNSTRTITATTTLIQRGVFL